MVKLSRKLSSRRHLRAPKAPKNMFPLRRSARLAPIVDDSRVEPLELCNDLVDYEDNGVIIHKFRVSISQLARAQMAASRQFEWADVSQSYCSDHALVPASLECNHPVIIKMSRFVCHQLGLFAARQITVGEIVVQYFGRYYTVGEYNFPEGHGSCSWAVDGPRGTPKRLLDAYEYGNEAAFVNHSCNANLGILETYLWEKNTLSGIAMRALRDIEAGEELTVPYYHPTQLPPHFRHRIITACSCRSGFCTGVVFWQDG